MLRLKSLITLVVLLLTIDAFASHYAGGEITWQCLGNGRFRFIMKLYRECNGITYNNQETILSNSSVPSITMSLYPGGDPLDGADGNLDGKTDISPSRVCWDPTLEIHCHPDPPVPNTGAIEEWYYTSDQTYPAGVLLAGVPPASGWIFSYSSGSRNPCTNITNASSLNWFLRAVMYPYQGQNTFPCYDNSPEFAERPSTVIGVGYPFTYNHNATDKELDSLAYDWAPALTDAVTPVPYAPGFAYNNPLPGPLFNPLNVAAVMNAYTGEISYTSYTNGAFVTVTKVTAYRCGVKIAEIFREMQIVLLPNQYPNNPPQLAPPFYNPVSGLYDLYVDTVYAGETVDFDITSIDMDLLPNNNPQTLTLEASGQDFGAGFSNPAVGCLNPPCATLNPPPVITAMVAVATHFHWQTACEHLSHPYPGPGCATTYNIHNFVIKVYDDNCPGPGMNIATITIVVLPKPVLPPPEIHCVAVDPAGNVTLTWEPPPDPVGTFDSYHIFHSTSPTGPFTVIDSIFTYAQTSYTDVFANANSGPQYYYIETRSGCGGLWFSAPGDTISSIHLDVTPIGGGQIAQLDWNPIHVPPPATSYGWYRIYREYPAGTWVLIDSVQGLTYQDIVTVCSDTLSYRVEIGDSIGCISVSSIDSAALEDGSPPDMPILDSVSVDLITGKTVLGWEPTIAQDTRKYNIFYRECETGPWFLIGSSIGINNTTYTDMASNPQARSESYCIAAVDSCNQTSSMGLDHCSIFLEPPGIDICADKIRLTWSSYKNMNPPVQGYRVFMSENGAPYSQIADVAAPSINYDDPDLTEMSSYCYYIQGYNNDSISSTSNTQCIIATKPNEPQYIFLRYVTVVDNEYAKLGFFVDSTAHISGYKILRSEDGISYSDIATIPATTNTANATYDDYHALVNEKSYYYKVVVMDSCNMDAITSNVGRSIYLYGNSDTYMLNYVEWTPYEDREPQVYNIFRQIDDYDLLNRAASVQWGEITYNDDVAPYTETSGRFNYMIEAPLYDIFLQQFPFADTVYSNKIILLQEPRVYVPNAFTPNGLNPIFKPVGVFVDTEDYFMAIYSRWGNKLFESTDINSGWDGYYNGKVCEMGGYVYFIRFKLPDGEYFQKRGSVTLIR
jgi:gliding motility-associated-like protein